MKYVIAILLMLTATATRAEELNETDKAFVIKYISSIYVCGHCGNKYLPDNDGSIGWGDRNGVDDPRRLAVAVVTTALANARKPYNRSNLDPRVTRLTRDMMNELVAADDKTICDKLAKVLNNDGFLTVDN